MIGKQTKGTSFGSCVCYVLREDKSKLLEAVGVEGTPEQMAELFELQTLLNDKNDFYRNEKVCKMLTAKYRLHFANGKDNIKEERLRPYDRAKHEVYKALKEELPHARSWNELKEALSERDVEMKFKVSRTTREVQGVKFEYGGISFLVHHPCTLQLRQKAGTGIA